MAEGERALPCGIISSSSPAIPKRCIFFFYSETLHLSLTCPSTDSEPVSNVPAAPSTNTHFKVRRDAVAHKQVVAFINGVVQGVGERDGQDGP